MRVRLRGAPLLLPMVVQRGVRRLRECVREQSGTWWSRCKRQDDNRRPSRCVTLANGEPGAAHVAYVINYRIWNAAESSWLGGFGASHMRCLLSATSSPPL